IALAPLNNVSVLFARVQQRLNAVEIDPANFIEVMDKPLDDWLATEFFKHHTKQFKKRPIAWQVQSNSFTDRAAPAFACLVYYHKLDIDLLHKIRKMAEDLRTSRGTELRGIAAVAPDARSDRQEKRRVELEDAVAELQKFDATLAAVAAEGFRTPALRQFAL